MLQFAGVISESIQAILITFDSTLYRFVGWLYEVYLLIASARIIQQDDIENFMKRLMVVVGIVTLFIIAFSLIKALIDPEKEVKNTSKIFVNVITSIIMLTLVNTAFNYLYQFQNVLLKNNVIGRIIIGGVKSGEFDINSAGTDMAADTFAAFFVDDPYIAAKASDEDARCHNKDGKIIATDDITDETECYYTSEEVVFGINSDYTSIAEVTKNAKRTGHLTISFLDLAKPVDNKAVDFSFFLALICAGFMIYIFVSFCLDMAVRCAKLAVLQIISPVPILARIIPGQESIFNNWIKKTMTTFMEVFIRIAIIFFCIYLISTVSRSGGIHFSNDIISGTSGRGVESTAKVAVILGILMFAKQAPSFISQIFGIDSGSMKLGIKDKLGTMVGAGAVGAVAGGVTGFIGGGIASRQNGGKFLSGGLSGATEGFKGKGNQWKKQGTKVYQNLTGDYKGSVGYFGRKTIGTRVNEKVSASNKANKKLAENRRNQFENNYINQQAQKEAMRYQNVEESAAFKNIYDSNSVKNEALAETKEYREEFKKRNGRNLTMKEYSEYLNQAKRRITRDYFARNVVNNKYEGSSMNSEYKKYVENLNKVTDSNGNISSSRIAENFIAPQLEKDMQDVKDGNKQLSSLSKVEQEIFKNRKIDEAIGKEKANKQWADIMKEGFKDAPDSSPFSGGGSSSSSSGGSSSGSSSSDKK